MRQRTRWTALTAAALAALASLADGSAAPPTHRDFGERVTVRETELVFGPDDDLTPNEPASAFAVFADGARREVVRAERLKDEPWRIVVYVDPLLGSPASGHLAALALSHASEDLAERGEVELAMADPEPATVLAPTREPRLLADRFAALAGELARRADGTIAPAEADAATVRRQLDRLVVFLTARPRPAPHAVILLADGRDLPAAVLNALGGDRVDPDKLPDEGGARSYARAAQALAAYGWVTIPMTLRAPSGPEAEVSSGGMAHPGEHGGAAFGLAEIWRRMRGKHPRRPADPRLADYGADPRLGVLRMMARMTDGAVVGSPASLDTALADLPWRWHLWFSNPATDEGKRFVPVSIELVRLGKPLRGQQWVR
jgi:hypothetical protein